MADPFDLAAKQIGLNERDQNAALQDYLKTGGVNLDPATTAWCAAFVNSTLAQSGQEGTGSNMARSFMDWGQGVDTPEEGDLAVFRRGDPNGPFGHVGFFQGYNPDGTIQILGGNQGDSVNSSSYGADMLLGFRRGAPGAPPEIAPPDPTGLEGLMSTFAGPAPSQGRQRIAAAPSTTPEQTVGLVKPGQNATIASLLQEVQTASQAPAQRRLPSLLG